MSHKVRKVGLRHRLNRPPQLRELVGAAPRQRDLQVGVEGEVVRYGLDRAVQREQRGRGSMLQACRVRVRILHWPSSTTATAEVSPSARRELMLSRKLQTTERPSQAARESVSSYRESSAW